jgi:AcrR family transcriptional regulator
MDRPNLRDSYRQHLRDRVLEVAHELVVAKGWEKVRVGEIAELAGTSRAMLYKEFGDKQGLGDALVLREAQRFLDGIRAELGKHDGDAAGGLAAAVQYTLREAARSPLLKAVLISHREAPFAEASKGMLPLLTTSFSILEVASAALAGWFGEQFPELDTEDVADATDALVRLTVSHLALPNATIVRTGGRITEVGLRYLGLRQLKQKS